MHRLTTRNMWARGSPTLNLKIVIFALHEQKLQLNSKHGIKFLSFKRSRFSLCYSWLTKPQAKNRGWKSLHDFLGLAYNWLIIRGWASWRVLAEKAANKSTRHYNFGEIGYGFYSNWINAPLHFIINDKESHSCVLCCIVCQIITLTIRTKIKNLCLQLCLQLVKNAWGLEFVETHRFRMICLIFIVHWHSWRKIWQDGACTWETRSLFAPYGTWILFLL